MIRAPVDSPGTRKLLAEIDGRTSRGAVPRRINLIETVKPFL